MAVELATGYVSIVPSARGFGSTLTRALAPSLSRAGTDSASRLEGAMSLRMGAIGTRIAGLLTAAFVVKAGKDFATFGIESAKSMEQTRIAFRGLIGDVELADKTISDLQNFAAVSPFKLDGLAESAKMLLAVGFAAEDLIPTMTILGNLGAALGVKEDDIKGVVRALGQMKGKGKAAAEEMRQISEAVPGFSAINAVADDLGITVQEAFVQMEKGAIPADRAIKAILKGMEKFPGAAGAMERQSKTLTGVMSTLHDTIEIALIKAIEPFLPGISAGILKAMPQISAAVGTLSNFFNAFRTGAADVNASGLAGFMERFGAGTRIVADAVIAFVRDALGGLGNWWDEHGPAITTFADKFATAMGATLREAARVIQAEVLPRLNDLINFIVDNEAVMVGILAAIATGFAAWAIQAGIAAAATIAATWPFLLAAAAIGILAAAFYYAYTNSESFRIQTGFAIAAMVSLREQAEFLIDTVSAALSIIKGLGETAYFAIKKALDALNALSRAIPGGGGGGPLDVLKDFILGGPGGLFGGFFADGGFFRGGKPIIVGEDGPEMILPKASGQVVSNGALTTAFEAMPVGGGGRIYHTVINNPVPERASDSLRALRRIGFETAAV